MRGCKNEGPFMHNESDVNVDGHIKLCGGRINGLESTLFLGNSRK
jgi:hypothetical protein